MELRKQSAMRDRGALVIVPSTIPRIIRWSKKSQSVTLLAGPRREGGSTYEYEIYLSVRDIQEIIGCLAENGIDDCQDEVSREFSSQLDKLLKLIMCSIGMGPLGNAKDRAKRNA